MASVRRNNSFSRTPKALADLRRRSTPAMTNVAMDRQSMLVVEANEISQCLNKHYVFNKDDTSVEDTMVVKVTNTMLGLSCRWTMEKLRERLVQMRKLMYSADADKSTMAGETVFFDPSDTWTKDEPVSDVHIMESPRMKKSREKRTSSKSHEAGSKSQDVAATRPQEVSRPVSRGSVRPQEGSRPMSRGSSVPRDLMGNVIQSQDSVDVHNEPVSNARPRVCEVYPTVKNRVRDESQTSVDDNQKPSNPENSPEQRPASQTSVSSQPTGRRSSLTMSHRSESPALCVSPSARQSPASHRSPSPSIKRSSSPPSMPSSVRSSPSNSPATRRRFSQRPTSRHGHDNDSVLPDRYLQKPEEEEESHQKASMTSTAVQTDKELRSSPVVRLALDMVKLVRDRLRSGDKEGEVLMDHILYNCESLKVIVVNILEGFTQVQDSGDDIVCFNDSDLLKTSSMQLLSALELLVSNTRQLASHEMNTVTAAIYEKISGIRNELATELVILLHECQNASESGVQESSSRVMDLVYDMVHQCGRWVMSAAEACPMSLRDTPHTIQQLMMMRSDTDTDVLNKYPDNDIKQSFITGCDAVLKLALSDAQDAVHTCEKSLLVLAESSPKTVEAVVIHSHRLTGASRGGIRLLTHIQSQVGRGLMDDKSHLKDYFYHYYNRDLQVASKVNTLVSGLTMLAQATHSLVQDEEQGSFRRVLRCGEIIQNAIYKLVQVSCHDLDINENQGTESPTSFSSSNTSLNKPESPVSCVLSSGQALKLQTAGSDVITSAAALIGQTKQHVKEEAGNQKMRRMLPAPPHSKTIMRCHSARSHDKNKLTKHRSMVDITTHEA